MSTVFTRRNAMLGWLAWSLIRRRLRRRTEAAVAGLADLVETPTKRHRLRNVVVLGAVAAGGYALWQKVRGGGGADDRWETYEPSYSSAAEEPRGAASADGGAPVPAEEPGPAAA